jgi:hypothetical protein
VTTAAERAKRNAQAVELHLAGVPTAKIAEQIGLSPSATRKVISAGLAERVGGQANLPDDARTEVARIDGMIAAIWARARRGDLDAIDRVARLNERREKVARPRLNEHRMRTAVDTTVGASRDISPQLDAAVIEGAQLFADQLDDVLANGTSLEVTKALYLMPHLKNFLESMLATPAARRNAGIAATDAGRGRLAHLQNVTSIARGGPA